VFPEYLALDSQTPEQFAEASQGSQAEFEKAMWERPIGMFQDGASVIMDPVFFSAKLSIGPLFFLLRDHPERAKALFPAFGLAFEDYANAIVGRMFKNTHFNLKKANGKDTDFEVDALAAEGPTTFVFEAKAKFLKEDLISCNDYADFVGQEMRALFDAETDQTSIRPLAIMTIQDLENMEGSVATGEFSLAAFLADYAAETRDVDPLCSLHNFIPHSKYAGKMRPKSSLVFQKSIETVDRAKAVLFPKENDDGAPS
jgi:hypothetical protein